MGANVNLWLLMSTPTDFLAAFTDDTKWIRKEKSAQNFVMKVITRTSCDGHNKEIMSFLPGSFFSRERN